nr:MAG TPA: hypothetical protein [Caudoviricetes sp.]DAO26317.1 MAG TPA: hypothetical protein [Caudoviricetes sp.]
MFLLCQNGNKSLTFHFQLNNYFQNGKIHPFFHFRPRHDVKRSFYYVKLN